jgi:hypothetical protein
MTSKVSVTSDETTTEPVVLREGDGIAFVIYISGIVSTLANPTMAFYKQNTGTDQSATYFTGSMSVNGLDTIITKVTQNLKAGNWVMSIGATVDGLVQNVATVPVIIKRQNEV